MNDLIRTLSLDARRLTPDERLELVDLILESVGCAGVAYDGEWMAEIEERIAAEQRGEAELIPAAVVFAKHRQK